MFFSKLSSTRTSEAFSDLTITKDVGDWHPGILRVLNYHFDVVAIAFDPIFGLLASGTSSGVIRVFGAPGVDVSLDLPEPLPVSFLRFSTSTRQLVCIDARDQLHVWDLSQVGRPLHQLTAALNCSVSDISLSPFHTHALILFLTGEIRAYDLLSFQLSPYMIPNLWKLYIEGLNVAMKLPPDPVMEMPMEIVCHPLDLNWIFVVFRGGVVLCDLAKRSAVAVYKRHEPVIEDSIQIASFVTSMAVHPSGHFFAVGYADGSIGFWEISDETQPLFVNTLAGLGENVSGWSAFEQSSGSVGENDGYANLEPVCKLAWYGSPDMSNPLGGDTLLLVLGGFPCPSTSDRGLVALLMPAFNPTSSTSFHDKSSSLHLTARDAMVQTLSPKKAHFYSPSALVRDFCVVSCQNPRHSGVWDPAAVICLCSNPSSTQGVETFRFPPRNFSDGSSAFLGNQSDSSKVDIIDHLGALLEEIKFDLDQEFLIPPGALRCGPPEITRVFAMNVKCETMDELSRASTAENELVLRGGAAWANPARLTQGELAKYHPKRLLITIHGDASVRFHDISPQLLISTRDSPMTKDFPETLADLNIDVCEIFADPQLNKGKLSVLPEIQSVQFAQESLECSIALETGEVILYRFQLNDYQKRTPKKTDDEIVVLDQSLSACCKYRPYLMLHRRPSKTTSCSLNDVGFLAVGYADGCVSVVDLRGPCILRLPPPVHTQKGPPDSRPSNHRGAGGIVSLTWTVSGVASDQNPSVRLISVHESGISYVYKLARESSSSSYSFVEAVTTETLPNLFNDSSFVIDSKTGALMRADKTMFAATLQQGGVVPANSCFWVTASAGGAECRVDITGVRVGRVNWSSKQNIIRASIVERNGSQSLVAWGSGGEIFVYTLPYLELLHTTTSPMPASASAISVDTTGDFVYCETTEKPQTMSRVILASLFSSGRVYDEPVTALLEHMATIPPIPPKPQQAPPGLLSLLSAWLGPPTTASGDQLDNIFAGQNRPVSRLQLPDSGTEDVEPAGHLSAQTAAANTLRHARAPDSVYGRLSSALAERGERLGDVEQRVESTALRMQDMVTEAKRLAAKQEAKRWFGL